MAVIACRDSVYNSFLGGHLNMSGSYLQLSIMKISAKMGKALSSSHLRHQAESNHFKQ